MKTIRRWRQEQLGPIFCKFGARVTYLISEIEAFERRVARYSTFARVYLQRMAGYALTGSTQEHALFFLYGTGANGKSVFVNTLATILGDYAANAPMDTFMETRTDRHPTDMAGLRGARFVAAIETEQGRRWAESKVKNLTGGDKISARFMRQDFFEFFPQFKLFVAGTRAGAGLLQLLASLCAQGVGVVCRRREGVSPLSTQPRGYRPDAGNDALGAMAGGRAAASGVDARQALRLARHHDPLCLRPDDGVAALAAGTGNRGHAAQRSRTLTTGRVRRIITVINS